MNTVVSASFEIVIPSQMRRSLGITPGSKLHAIEYRGQIALVPVVAMESARGMFPGIDTSVPRTGDRY